MFKNNDVLQPIKCIVVIIIIIIIRQTANPNW